MNEKEINLTEDDVQNLIIFLNRDLSLMHL